jgi:hypothetical protein
MSAMIDEICMDSQTCLQTKHEKDLMAECDIDWSKALDMIKAVTTPVILSFDLSSPCPQRSQELYGLALAMMDHFHQRKPIPREVMEAILTASIPQHRSLPNVIPVSRYVKDNGEYGSLVVVGDTHGQYMDVHHIFQPDVAGYPSDENRYIFNGDIVGRGHMSVEILAVLLTFRLACPTSVTIVRGNHETTDINDKFGFKTEVLLKFDNNYQLLFQFRALFNALPIAAVIEEKGFVVHGGLGASTKDCLIEELNRLFRYNLSPYGAVFDLLWAGK